MRDTSVKVVPQEPTGSGTTLLDSINQGQMPMQQDMVCKKVVNININDNGGDLYSYNGTLI